ncbi:MAG: Asp-tRNA(Asn)/Glu-tRNA(Gln) amidotransferase subunit GatB [Candidatus Doudnabacteria bacterium]|nr:Asp-tRNA(Asn)/Glu-tRNA(Gln) amidotransferase subunit GatB [Candidatus Doudnabacteria bacterium]
MAQPVIGLEIHVQAKTKSKMFSPVSAEYFADEPNSHVDPVSLGLPGAMPVPNEEAIRKCIAISLALNCQINQKTKFDRKNYFYPDLPKGYQISQYDYPVGHDGYLEIDVEGDARRIRIRRVHIEEDTGKSIHTDDGTLLDYNKAGVPLIEIVTEPDFQELKEVTAFAKLLKQTVQYVGISDAEMQKGQMRFELNISVRTNEPDGKLPNYKVEVKNIGSISVLEKVLQFEVKRQSEILAKGEKVVAETRGIRDMSGATVSQRLKETEDDYRYFPEPDIPPIYISDEWLAEIRSELPELPAARRDRYVHDWGLELEQAEILVEQRDKGDWIDLLSKDLAAEKLKQAVKWFIGDVSGLMEKKGVSVAELPVSPTDLIFLVESVAENKISGTIVKKVLEEMFESGGRAEEIVKSQGLEQISDSGALEKIVDEVIVNNQKLVDSLAKNPNAINALVGQVMKATKGQANPKLAEQAIRTKLGVS